MNKCLNYFKSSIRHYFDLCLFKEHAKIEFKENCKRVEGLPGIIFIFLLGLISKIILFFFLLGGYKSGIDFGNFYNTCSLLFFPELLIFDIEKLLNLGIHKTILIVFLIIFANIINIIVIIEKFKKLINYKKSI